MKKRRKKKPVKRKPRKKVKRPVVWKFRLPGAT